MVDLHSFPTPRVRFGVLSGVTAMLLLPVLGAAQTLPPSVQACAAISDVLARLSCYDREVARYMTAAPAAAGVQVAPSTVAAAAAPPSPAVSPPAATSPPQHIAAHVVKVHNVPDDLVVQLDNGQVWEQVQVTTAELNLRAGDAITIDRSLGSYWLSGPDRGGQSVQVRQRP